ncbi:MAG: hypothetical protein J6Y16_02335 [Treponema sp.]|nr:hypothetical protein [Treponema sp.]
MKKTAIVLVLLSIVFLNGHSETTFKDYKKICDSVKLELSAFPKDSEWNGKRKTPVLDTAQKKNYKTIILEAAKQKPNFNGKYRIVTYGAGTMANSFFIIDLETGIVTEGFTFEFNLEYSVDSRMIIRNSPSEIIEFWEPEISEDDYIPDWSITEYYIFSDNSFTKVLEIL